MKWNGGFVTNRDREQCVTPLSVIAASQYLDKVKFIEFINQRVRWDMGQCNLTPGMLAKSVVLSTFTAQRSPLYRINDMLSGMDLEGLFGLPCYGDEFTDDAIGRTLDKLYEANLNSLYTNFSLSCLAAFDVPVNSLHADTTSISLTGAYEHCEAEEYEGLSICHGYSKDHRPDLKQVMVGQIVTEHGIPLVSQALNGNTADSEFNQQALMLLNKTFGQRMKQLVYIADSKPINKPTLKVLHSQPIPIQFISRCPDAFQNKIAVKMKKQAFLDCKWTDQGVMGEKKKCAHYHTQSYPQTIDGIVYRFIVVQTSAGRDRTNKRVTKSEQELLRMIENIEKQTFACEADAQTARNQLQAQMRSFCHQVELNVQFQQTTKRARGNPGKTAKPPIIETIWKIKGKILGLNEEKVAILRQKDESFVLITNISATEKQEYKRQYVVEVQFHLLKQPAVASSIFLKKPERIEALLMLLAIALLIRGLMQFRVRNRIQSYKDKPKLGLNRNQLINPTAEAILYMLRLHHIVRKKDTAWCACRDEEELARFNFWTDLLGIELGNT